MPLTEVLSGFGEPTLERTGIGFTGVAVSPAGAGVSAPPPCTGGGTCTGVLPAGSRFGAGWVTAERGCATGVGTLTGSIVGRAEGGGSITAGVATSLGSAGLGAGEAEIGAAEAGLVSAAGTDSAIGETTGFTAGDGAGRRVPTGANLCADGALASGFADGVTALRLTAPVGAASG